MASKEGAEETRTLGLVVTTSSCFGGFSSLTADAAAFVVDVVGVADVVDEGGVEQGIAIMTGFSCCCSCCCCC